MSLKVAKRIAEKKLKNKPKHIKNSNIIRQPKTYLRAGILLFVLGLSVSIAVLFLPDSMVPEDESFKGRIVLSLLMFLSGPVVGIFVIIVQVNWKIEVGESRFTFTNMFGRKRTYLYEKVKVRVLARGTKFYCNNKHIVNISIFQENADALELAIFAYQKIDLDKLYIKI